MFLLLFVKSAASIPELFSSFIGCSDRCPANKDEVRKTDKTTTHPTVHYSKIQDTEGESKYHDSKRVMFSVKQQTKEYLEIV